MPNLPNYQSLPEDVDDPVVLMEHVCRVVEDGNYWNAKIKSAFATVGFLTTRIQREDDHPSVWLAWLTRTTFDLSPDHKTASRQLRKALNRGGIKVVRNEFNIIDRRGDKLRCVFVLDLGAPGVA
jgi:hypothetical protein